MKHDGKTILLVGAYVDDCAVAGKPSDVNWLKAEVKNFFTIKELGTLKKYLGVWYNGEMMEADNSYNPTWKIFLEA